MIQNSNKNWYLAVLCAVVILFILIFINNFFFKNKIFENKIDDNNLFSSFTTENGNSDINNIASK